MSRAMEVMEFHMKDDVDENHLGCNRMERATLADKH